LHGAIRLAYLTDQPLPLAATDTLQLAAMASAFGAQPTPTTLMFPVLGSRPAPTGEDIASYYQVAHSFTALPQRVQLRAFRGWDKVMFAAFAAARCTPRDYDVIYTRNLPVVLAALARSDLPVVYETYRPWPAQDASKRALFRWLLRQPRLRGLVLHSELAARAYRQLGFENERLLVAHNGVDPELISSGSGAPARQELGLPPERPIVVYTGRISPAKGLGAVLDLAERFPSALFCLVGSESEGPIERRARTLSNVEVHPWQPKDRVAAWLSAADVLLIPPVSGPLEREGTTVLPIKTFQYLAAGRAILAPDAADVREVLTDDDNALLVPPDDFAAAASALERLLRDDSLRARLGERGQHSVQHRTWAARAAAIMSFVRLRLAASAGHSA
jgi:glycosyltransferase involved in cell wall biosynthesis